MNTEYKVLARKYRPQKFNDLIGQEVLVKTLTNSILQNRIAHAYILTGVRGVGKTTTARLIAMSLNCEKRSEKTCEPCGSCISCLAVFEDNNLDVLEMDAASKTGVDDIREIIDNIKYKPVNSKYKIFIIDEVHMLSKSAFNALLKTLEEPPEHVKFIFATTEVKKIPITIISRCQRFDLLRIQIKDLSEQLSKISIKEKINIDQEALNLIVRSADGSMRDGLSLLDQAIANENENITTISIVKMLGLANREKVFDLLESIFNGDAPQAIKIYNSIYEAGADVVMIFDEMLNIVHFITQMKIAPELKNELYIPELERIRGQEISSKISMTSLGIIWQVLFKGYEELQSGYHLFQHGEMIILRLIHLYDGPNPDDLIKKYSISNLEANTVPNKTKDELNTRESNQINITKNIEQKSTNIKGIISVKSYRHFVDLFYKNKEAILHTHLYNNVKLILFTEGEIEINSSSISDKNFNRSVAKLISKWTGRIWQVSGSTSNLGQSLYEEDLIQEQKEIDQMKEDSEVKNLLDSFPGIKIHSITNIKETIIEENETIQTSSKKEK
ncbi:DNA polymerase III subunit gamma/tau [Alphaproteobacteria bacterium]|nr:DNA polymerase III subunit gamma/tau [Alphaproteobacteria bacterium]